MKHIYVILEKTAIAIVSNILFATEDEKIADDFCSENVGCYYEKVEVMNKVIKN